MFSLEYVPRHFSGNFLGNNTDESPSYTVVVSSISCPDDAKTIIDCDFNTTDNHCPAFDEIITCVESEFILSVVSQRTSCYT